MPRAGLIAAVLLCLAVFALSVWALLGRIETFNSGRELYQFKDVTTWGFGWAGRDVTLSEETRENQVSVLVRYGDRELRLLATADKLGHPDLPPAIRHQDWLHVRRFAAYRPGQAPEAERLIITTRRPLTAADPRTGSVWNRDWTFEFHELLTDGTIRTETLRYPRARGDKDPKPGELREGTWQKDAAMLMMPGSPPDTLNFGRPTASFKRDALRDAGWTFPAAIASGLGLIASLALLLAPRAAARVRAI